MDIKSVGKESLTKQLSNFSTKSTQSNDFDNLFTSAKNSSKRDDRFKREDNRFEKKDVDKVSNTEKPKPKNEVKDKKTDKVDKKEDVNETEKVSDDPKAEEVVKEKLNELMMLLSETLNIPVEEISEKLTEMVANGEELTLTNILGNLKGLLGEDFDMLKASNLKETIEQGKILLEEIATELDEASVDIDVEELIKNINSDNKNIFEKLNVTNVEVVNSTEKSTEVETNENTENTEVETEEMSEDNVVTEENSQFANEQKFSNNSNQQFSNNNFSNNQNNTNQNVQNVNITNDVQFTEQAVKVASKNQNLRQLDNFNVIEQIVNKMKVEVKADVSEIKIALSPEHLGDVSLKIATHNGVVTAQFTAENQRVKELIESQFSSLEDTLRQQGLDVENLSVEVNDNGQSRQEAYERGTYSYKGNVSNDDAEETENIPLESLDESGNVVSSKVNIEV